MKNTITYCVEYRRDDVYFYHLGFGHGFIDKDVALRIAEKASQMLHARVVEQRRKVVKVFPLQVSGEKT